MQKNPNTSTINHKYFSKKHTTHESKRTGKEHEHHNDDTHTFEGEYLNGQRHGKGKEHNSRKKGDPSFEGEHLYGKRNGKGKEHSELRESKHPTPESEHTSYSLKKLP